MHQPLKGKVAIVTGGARGIGAAIADILSSQGAKVMIADVIDADPVITEISKKLPAAEICYHKVDVRDEAQVKGCVDSAFARFGGIDIMINNAGTCGRVSLENITLDTWSRDIDTNLTGTFLFTKHCIHPHMLRQGGGTIINISSIAGIMGGPSANAIGSRRSGPAYAASKGGIIAFTKWVAKDYGPHGITCNSIAPGPIASEMTAELDYDFSQQFIKHMGAPVDIAEGAAYLAGASYVTGQVLRICGGAAVG